MAISKEVIEMELEKVRVKSKDKLLHPADVVKAARKESSPLHNLFLWDDTKAAEQWRLAQARFVIRSVKISNPNDEFRPPCPAYVALKRDVGTGGGYRKTEDVIEDDELKEALRDSAIRELRGWVERYRTLVELTGAVADVAGIGLEEEVTA